MSFEEIRDSAFEAMSEVDIVVPLPASAERNKRAIDAHAKLEQAASDLARYRKSAPEQEWYGIDELRIKIIASVRRLLQGVFDLPESDLPPAEAPDQPPEPPAHPSVGEGLVAIAKSIDRLAQAIHFNALPAHQRRRF